MDEEKINPAQFDFGSLDQVMMLMIYGATQLIEKTWSIERQAGAVAKFNAEFMSLRLDHEQTHTTKQPRICPFCVAMKLKVTLNRETVDG